MAKVPPVHGLYTTVIAGVIYSFLGTSRSFTDFDPFYFLYIYAVFKYIVLEMRSCINIHRQLSIGPVSMLTGSAVVQAGDGSVEKAVAIASLVTFFTGLLTLILGLIRLGFIDFVLSRALLRGFITAVWQS